MKTLEEIKTALVEGNSCLEDLSHATGRIIEWRLDLGAKHFNEHGEESGFSWPFIKEARTPEYLAAHLFARQGLFGEIRIR